MKRPGTARISCRVAVVLCVLCGGAAAPASAAPGDLDPTFGAFGKVVVKAPSGGDAAATDLVKRGGFDLDTLRAAAVKRGFKAVPLKIRAAGTLQQQSSRKT